MNWKEVIVALKGRRRFTPKQKLEIVVAGLSNGEKVSEACPAPGLDSVARVRAAEPHRR